MNNIYKLPPILKERIAHSRSTIEQLGWGLQRHRLPECWELATGKNVNIYILDTGGDVNHPELKNNVKGTYNAVTGNLDVTDVYGHGTHVSGISGADDNKIGMIGVAPDANIYLVNIFAGEGANLFDYLAGLDWVKNHQVDGPKVVNLSIGSPDASYLEEEKLTELYDAGITVVAAAGNDGDFYADINFPGRYDTTIAAASSRGDDNISDFSSKGKGVDLAAPGDGIISAVPGGGYQQWSGTSMAAPFVTGIVGLMLEINPKLTPAEIKDRLTKTATDIYEAGKDINSGFGLINPLVVLQALVAEKGTEEPIVEVPEDDDELEDLLNEEIHIAAAKRRHSSLLSILRCYKCTIVELGKDIGVNTDIRKLSKLENARLVWHKIRINPVEGDCV